MTLLTLVPPVFYNVKNYNAAVDGTTDDTIAINSAITAASSAGGGIVFLPGLCAISNSIILAGNVTLMGAGQGSGLTLAPNFTAAQVVLCNGNNCGVRDLEIVGGTTAIYSSNPATVGIQMTGEQATLLANVTINYLNGWAVQSQATASVSNAWTEIRNVQAYQCKQGFHVLGNTGSSFVMQHYFVDCNANQVQNGDGFLFEDAREVQCVNLQGNVGAGSGNVCHVKGATTSLLIANAIFGAISGVATGATVLIESGTNGSPARVTFSSSKMVAGNIGVTISAGSEIRFQACQFNSNATYGVNITGGDPVSFVGCSFNLNGQTAGASNYDFQSSSPGHIWLNDCTFLTPQGTSTGTVANAINVTAGSCYVLGSEFLGTGFGASTIFNNKPKVIRSCPGYNPLGSITAPTIGASPYTSPTQPTDCTVFVTGGTVSAIAIGGISTGLTSGTFRVPAGQTITLTYSVTPSWTWFAD